MKKILFVALAVLLANCKEDDNSFCESEPTFGDIEISEIGTGSINLKGGIVADLCSGEIKMKGIVYGKNTSPTVDGSKFSFSKTFYDQTIEELYDNTTYYLRPFVTTVNGEVIYGPTSQATTEEAIINEPCTTGMYNEAIGRIVIEAESATNLNGWTLASTQEGFSGDGYLIWEGANNFTTPNDGIIEYKLRIKTTGTYKFLWNSNAAFGNNGTEHNDSWLSFPDLALTGDFYGKKQNGEIVYPAGVGLEPTPEGNSANGYLKIYKNGPTNTWKWQSNTSDNQGHEVFINIETPGVYTMLIAARSMHHAIDKFVIYKESLDAPIGEDYPLSEICE